jgi:hypothetical protein
MLRQTRLSILCASALMASPLLAQTPSPPPPLDRQWLAGTWKLDKSGPPEDEKNWNRATRSTNRTSPTDGSGGSGTPPTPIPEIGNIASINQFGHTLIAPSDTLVLQVQPDAVTMRDDFREPMRYETTGRARTLEVLARYARSGGGFASAAQSFTVSVKTSWNGDALVQELWTRDLADIVRITRTFIPASEGRQMLLVIKVLQPKLKDPVKDIERLYVRQPS